MDLWRDGGSSGGRSAVDFTVPCPLLAGATGSAIADLNPSIERAAPGAELLNPCERPRKVRIILDGWAARQKTLKDGRRQIVGLMFVNDIGSYWTPVAEAATHEVRALTSCRVLRVDADALGDVARRLPFLASRLYARASADASMVHAWLLNIGQRKAPERIAHLFCELSYRLDAAGHNRGDAGATIPLTQQDLADALGMTSVHVNRVLQRLKLERMIDIRKGSVALLDTASLARLCDFDPSYLEMTPSFGQAEG